MWTLSQKRKKQENGHVETEHFHFPNREFEYTMLPTRFAIRQMVQTVQDSWTMWFEKCLGYI